MSINELDIMVGETMSVKRARELNAKDYFYQILKDNPKMAEIYPGVEDEIMEGAIDHHIHAYPDFVNRGQDMIEVAIDACKAKMRAIAFKDHWNITANAAYLTQRYIDSMYKNGELDHRVEVYGGIGLCFGMNPHVVREALKYPNMKMIWFPTFESAGYKRFAGKGYENGVPLCDENNEVLPNVVEIMEMAVDKKVGIGLGHTDYIELVPVVKKAKELGVRCVLDHPLLELNKLKLDQMKHLADLGAYVGTYCQPMIPSLYQCIQDPFETVQAIRECGAERCCSGSDFGQVLHVYTVEGIRIFVRALLAFGITPAEINVQLKDNPAKLMYLDE